MNSAVSCIVDRKGVGILDRKVALTHGGPLTQNKDKKAPNWTQLVEPAQLTDHYQPTLGILGCHLVLRFLYQICRYVQCTAGTHSSSCFPLHSLNELYAALDSNSVLYSTLRQLSVIACLGFGEEKHH
jgi:hypothetical protein